MRKISLSNFTHLNKIKWRIFIPVQKAWYVKKIARGGWSGFGKTFTWDLSQMITCHPKKIPIFLLKGGVAQFCHYQNLSFNVGVCLEVKITQNWWNWLSRTWFFKTYSVTSKISKFFKMSVESKEVKGCFVLC